MIPRRPSDDRASKPWLPAPHEIEETIEVNTPETGEFTIERTKIKDESDDQSPPSEPRPKLDK
ncbi:MAG TPA: hypothetical protein VGQ46_21025 [Thermoanaerobaculia bacterium]|jgi:hypothetical protein|nr:hypothetical protein [Thermoanaerobaculia bacterium]